MGYIPISYNKIDTINWNDTGTPTPPLQQCQSPFRLYRIFGLIMNRVLYQMKTCVSKIGVLLLLDATGWQCLNAPDYPDTPFIEFLSVSKDTLLQGQFMEDSLFVTFNFQDGDGDIGREEQDTTNNVFFIDERSGVVDNTFGIPAIPEEGAANGVEGEIKILLFSTCCYYSDGMVDACEQHPTILFDTVQYRIYIMDRAGHKSNEILTSPIILKCN